MERVPLHRIIYIVREGNYCVFQNETGTQYRIRSSLKSVYKNLPADKFIYINQIICNVSHIEKIEGDTVFLSDGSRINAAKGSVRKIKNTLLRFWTDASLLIFVLTPQHSAQLSQILTHQDSLLMSSVEDNQL